MTTERHTERHTAAHSIPFQGRAELWGSCGCLQRADLTQHACLQAQMIMPEHEQQQLRSDQPERRRKLFRKKASAPNPLAVRKSAKVHKTNQDVVKAGRSHQRDTDS
jgi:hypothetical protein